MAREEKSLIRRGTASGSTVRTLFDGGASSSERRAALVRVAGVGVIGGAGAAITVDQLAVHAGSVFSGVWAGGEPAIIATGAALGVAAVGIIGGRVAESDYNDSTNQERIREGNRSFYRRVGVAGLVVGGGLAAVAGGLDVASIGHAATAAHSILQTGEAFAGVGVVSAGVSRYFAQRSRTHGPRALGE